MNGPYLWVVVLGAFILAAPVLVSPAGWIIAAFLIAGWLLLTVGAPRALGYFVDLKKTREQGVRAARERGRGVRDRVNEFDDEFRRRER